MRFIKFLIILLFSLSAGITAYVHISDTNDMVAPEINCSADIITVSVKDSKEKMLSFVTATDKKDGDVTDRIIVESISPFIDKNTAKITYAVCDSENNVTKLEKDIVFTDYTAPEFSFSQQQVYYVGSTKVELLKGVSAYDSIDGDISSRVVISDSKIDLSQPGIYPVTYSVTTSKGVTSEITVNAYVYASRLYEKISLDSYLVYTDSSNHIRPTDYINELPSKYFYNDQVLENYKFEIINNVDYSKEGIHYITYRLTYIDPYNEYAEPMVIAEAYLAVAVRGENK